MDKKEAIDLINNLYPSDSQYSDTNEVGKKFMLESIEEAGFNWRDLPETVLIKWAEKCVAKDEECIARYNEKLLKK